MITQPVDSYVSRETGARYSTIRVTKETYVEFVQYQDGGHNVFYRTSNRRTFYEIAESHFRHELFSWLAIGEAIDRENSGSIIEEAFDCVECFTFASLEA